MRHVQTDRLPRRLPRAPSQRKPRTLTHESTARHEAGHAVVAIALGCRVVAARVQADGLGWCQTTHGRWWRSDPMIEGMIAWAGILAEGVDDGSITVDDGKTLRDLGFRAASIATLGNMTRDLIHAWHLDGAIGAVADLLLANVGRRVAGKKIRDVAMATLPAAVCDRIKGGSR